MPKAFLNNLLKQVTYFGGDFRHGVDGQIVTESDTSFFFEQTAEIMGVA